MSDTLFFNSKSADKEVGKGVNEQITNRQDYEELNKIVQWRKVLSNFYFSPFVFEGHTYNTVEHVFQSKKIALVDPDKAFWFTVNSGHEIGQGDGLIARKNRKLVILSADTLRKWDEVKQSILYDVLLAKFSQDAFAKHVLLSTRNAQLLHGARGIPIARQYELESVRDKLNV